jgi:hypothetical protein
VLVGSSCFLALEREGSAFAARVLEGAFALELLDEVDLHLVPHKLNPIRCPAQADLTKKRETKRRGFFMTDAHDAQTPP